MVATTRAPDATDTVLWTAPHRRSRFAGAPAMVTALRASAAAGAPTATASTMAATLDGERSWRTPPTKPIGNARYQVALSCCAARAMGVRSASPGERAVQLLLAAGAFALLATWWAAAGRMSGADSAEAVTAFGRVTGLLGAYACLVVLLLMARVPWLERSIGLVRLATWHRFVGTSAIVLILVHVGATAWGYALGNDGTVLGELGAMITDLPGMIAATIGTALLVLVGVTCARAARRWLPYGLWWLIHITTYAAVVLGFAHQLDTGDDFVGRPTAAAIWKGIVIAVLAAVAWWRIARPLADAWARRTRVAAVTPDGGGVSVWLEGDGAARRHARGGGFVLVRFLAAGLWSSARPYTITELGEGDRVRIVIAAGRSWPRGWPASHRARARSSRARSATSTAWRWRRARASCCSAPARASRRCGRWPATSPRRAMTSSSCTARPAQRRSCSPASCATSPSAARSSCTTSSARARTWAATRSTPPRSPRSSRISPSAS